MRKLLALMFCLAIGGLILTGCDKDDDDENTTTTPTVKTATLGSQYNTTTGGFYSIDENAVYTIANAFQNQSKIDMFCFWEEGNDFSIASPGSSINGIFTGAYSFDNWTTKNLTMFCKTSLTAAQFDALAETDNIIVTSFDTANDRKKAKQLQSGDVWAFKTTLSKYGLFKVTAVSSDTTGTVSFAIKVKK